MPEISDERLDEILAAAGKATPVAYKHPRLSWVSEDREDVRVHCAAGEEPVPIFNICDPATITTLIAEVKAARAGKGVGETVVVPLTPTAEMLRAGMDDLGWWVEPHNDMSSADAASINAMQMAVIEGLYRAMLAAAPALPYLEPQGAQEAVAWQWSDQNGKWYTVDTNTDRTSLVEQEELARMVAASNGGTVRPLYPSPTGNSEYGGGTSALASPPVPILGVTEERVKLAFRVLDAANPDSITLETVRAALTAASVQQPTHRHKKRGSEYVLIGYGRMQAEGWAVRPGPGIFLSLDPVDMREVAIYRAVDDGSLWVRPREEFEDGRFEVITDAGRLALAEEKRDG